MRFGTILTPENVWQKTCSLFSPTTYGGFFATTYGLEHISSSLGCLSRLDADCSFPNVYFVEKEMFKPIVGRMCYCETLKAEFQACSVKFQSITPDFGSITNGSIVSFLNTFNEQMS